MTMTMTTYNDIDIDIDIGRYRLISTSRDKSNRMNAMVYYYQHIPDSAGAAAAYYYGKVTKPKQFSSQLKYLESQSQNSKPIQCRHARGMDVQGKPRALLPSFAFVIFAQKAIKFKRDRSNIGHVSDLMKVSTSL